MRAPKLRDGAKSVTVIFNGIELRCEFDYYSGFLGSRTEPPEPEVVEFTAVNHCGEDIAILLCSETQEALSEQCLSELREAWEMV